MKKKIGYEIEGLELDMIRMENGECVEHYIVEECIDARVDDDGITDYTYYFRDRRGLSDTFDLSQQEVYELLETGETIIDDEMKLVIID